MVIWKERASLGMAFCLMASLPVFARQSNAANTAESCRDFVGAFYSWYSSDAMQHERRTNPDLVMVSRPELLSPDLLQQLKEDFAAQEAAGADLVSLDADPFVGADGSAERYLVNNVTIKHGKCWAQVSGVRDSRTGMAPEVTAELVRKDGAWLFFNFYFPSPTVPKAINLRDALRATREFRKRYAPPAVNQGKR